MRQYYVYTYLDPQTGNPFYVGKGHGGRSRRHLTDNGHSRQVKMKVRSIRAHGLEPIIDIILCADEANAFALEAAFIKLYGRRDDGGLLFNIAPGGEATLGFAGRKHSEASKQKIREAMRRRKFSPETIEKMRLAGLRRDVSHLYSPESLEKLKTVRADPAYRSRLSESIRKSVSAEHMARITSLAAEKNRGCVRSLEHRQAISRAVKARVLSDETRAKMSASQTKRCAR